MSGERFSVTTPSARTSSGNRASAWLTRFCTWTCARSTGVPMSNVTVRLSTPSAVADDDMYSMCSTPLIASSRGVPTVWASTVGFAPGYTARTAIVGGVTSGYSLIGSDRIAISPAARMTSDRTTAKIGRSMKKREKRICVERWAWSVMRGALCVERGAFGVSVEHRGGYAQRTAHSAPRSAHSDVGLHDGGLGDDLHPRAHAHQTVDDDALPRLQSRIDGAKPVDHATGRHRPILERVIGLQHEHELSILVRADGLILDQRRRALLPADEPHAREQSRRKALRLVRHHRADANRACAAIEPVVHEVERALGGKAGLIGEADVARPADRLSILRTIRVHILQVRLLVAVEVNVDRI